MKTQEELNVIKEEVEALNKKLVELTEDELKQVVGGKGGSGEPDIDMSIENESIPVNPHETCPRCKIGYMQVAYDYVTHKPFYLVCSYPQCGYMYTPDWSQLIGY